MAAYTADQLREGVEMEALSAGVAYNFELSPPTGPGTAYFTVETIVPSGLFTTEPKNAIGTYSGFSDIDADSLVTSSYTSGVVVSPQGGTYIFTPTSNVAISSSMVKGTGGMTLTIT